MRFCLYKLRFVTPVHFGGESGSSGLVAAEHSLRSDSFFSALCEEAAALGKLEALLEAARGGDLILSDLLPFIGEEYYLPKPFLQPKKNRKIEAGSGKGRKLFKKLPFIPVSRFAEYIDSALTGADLDPEELLKTYEKLGRSEVRTLAAVRGLDDSLPFHLGVYVFNEDAGLYVLTAVKDEKTKSLFEIILKALAFSGLGGKRSAGLGKFEPDDVIYLDEPYHENLEKMADLLSGGKGGSHITLNTSLPLDSELEKVMEAASYSLVRRGGFVGSTAFAARPLKKNELYAFAAGSCFKLAFEGGLYEVSGGAGSHPVYRYLKPLFAEVAL